MFELYTTPTFDRKLQGFLRKHPELEKEIQKKLDLLLKNPFDPQLKTHRLSGRLKAHRAIALTHEYRILFILSENKIYLTNIGSHDEVY